MNVFVKIFIGIVVLITTIFLFPTNCSKRESINFKLDTLKINEIYSKSKVYKEKVKEMDNGNTVIPTKIITYTKPDTFIRKAIDSSKVRIVDVVVLPSRNEIDITTIDARDVITTSIYYYGNNDKKLLINYDGSIKEKKRTKIGSLLNKLYLKTKKVIVITGIGLSAIGIYYLAKGK